MDTQQVDAETVAALVAEAAAAPSMQVFGPGLWLAHAGG